METISPKRAPVIGVLIGDVSFDFTTELMAGISEAGAKANMQVMFLLGMQSYFALHNGNTVRMVGTSHNSVYDYASLFGADAFIIACGSLTGFSGGGLDRQFLARFAGVPYVVLQERIEIDGPKKTYIVVDNYHSFSQCIEHLIVKHGYTKIAFVSGPEGHADARQRMGAYLDCMQKYGLPVTRKMIAFGDYSEYVDALVSRLIDENPGLQAIAFANDEMAKAGYRECRRRGLVVGRDIAITGFDNFNSGRTMEPPLTTVSQDTYRMGQLAVENTAALMEGKTTQPVEMRTEFLIRQSCGCERIGFCFPADRQEKNADGFIDTIIREIVNGYTGHFMKNDQARQIAALKECFLYMRSVALEAPREPMDYNELAGHLETFFTKFDQSTLLLSQCLEDFMLQLLSTGDLSPAVGKFAAAISYMQQYIHTRELRLLESRLETYHTQSWIAPELTRGLFSESDEDTIFRSVMERLVNAGLRNAYICLLDKPISCARSQMTEIPQRLYLTAYAEEKNVHVYARNKRPLLDADHPLSRMADFGPGRATMTFSLFSGESQYGVLLCDEDRTKSALLHVVGLQLGMLLNFLGLREKEKIVAEELEDIREKNEILNFLSEYDSLCGLLNRRGFIERAIRRNRENIGKTAYCAFMDLDYLKQINDTFGHSEGDSALQGVSMILKRIAGKNDLLGRIGGDEFVGLFLSEDPGFEKSFQARFEAECERYNGKSDRPYWLDVSVGLTHFVCRQGLEVSSVLADADQYLYEAKRRRVSSGLRLK